jgi:prepilin-type N-terminal cleavage/methylation domain-containing protein
MKKAFTMIELIFVIVILGILAAVALPKFIGVAQQAREGNLKSFTGTLNRTLGPSWWSQAMPNDGNVSTLGINSIDKLKRYTDIPKELSSWNLNKCDDPNAYKVVGTFDKNKIGSEVNYYLACKDGTPSEAPKFMLIKPTTANDDHLALGDANSSSIAPDNTINFKDNNTDYNQTVVQK